MALISGTSIKIQDCALGIQHSVADGQAMLGQAPVVPDDPDPPFAFDDVRKVVVYTQPADGQMGLFDPGPFVNSKIHPYCVGVQIQGDGSLTWDVYVTSGDPELGTPSEEDVHAPQWDMPVASSTDLGNGPAYVAVNRELLPGQRIRVITNAASGQDLRVLAMFANTVGAGGRLVGG